MAGDVATRLSSHQPELFRLVAGCEWQSETIGCSGAGVFRLRPNAETEYFLKISRAHDAELVRERDVLRWLPGRLLAPEVLAWAEDAEYCYLLTTALPGRDASRDAAERDPAELGGILGAALRMIHGVPVEGCPFDQRLSVKLAAAEERLRDGRVDESDFDTARVDRTAASLWEELQRTRPTDEDLVFTHGDFCLPNVLVHQASVAGFVDWGRAGIADRYQDLALAVRSIEFNGGSRAVPALLSTYGLADLDSEKLAFYQLLDEFF